MLTQAEKAIQVEKLREEFSNASSVFLTGFSGITVTQFEQLRGELYEAGSEDYSYRVTKNSILRRAAEGLPVGQIAGEVRGPTAIAIARGEPVTLAKLLVNFSKANKGFEVKGAVLGEHVLSEAEISTLATLPNLDGMRSKLIGLIQAPATKLARLLMEPAAQVARVLDARGKQAS